MNAALPQDATDVACPVGPVGRSVPSSIGVSKRTDRRSVLAMLVVLFLLGPVRLVGQEELGNQNPKALDNTADQPPAETTLPLPVQDRDGRPFRPIGIYQSQVVDVVPPTFRAASIDELREALGNDSERISDADEARLISGFYEIRLDDQLLVSERSELIIEHRPRRMVRRRLGAVNLAILDSYGASRGSIPPGVDRLPRLEVDQQGELIAVVPASAAHPESTEPAVDHANADAPSDARQDADQDLLDRPQSESPALEAWLRSEVRFEWTLQSQPAGQARKFDLRLPRTSQTRLVISTPSEIELESSQGVLVERPGPPPDADVQSRTGDIRWYVLEAGGVNRIELYAKKRSEDESKQPFYLRRQWKEYEVDLSGVTWVHRMAIELPDRLSKLRLSSPLGSVTAIRVNSIEAEYRLLPRADGQTLIEVHLPGGLAGGSEVSVTGAAGEGRSEAGIELQTVTVEGTSTWDLEDGICDLASVTVAEPTVFCTESLTRSIVTILDPLEIARWTLPAHWRQTIQAPNRAGASTLMAEGPPPVGEGTPETPWSRLRLIEKPERAIDEIWTRLRVQETPSRQVRSTTRIRCQLFRNHQSPFRFAVNPDWTIDSVVVVGSGRQSTTALIDGALVVWPTPSESSQPTLEIELEAHQNLPGAAKRLRLPATWIIRTATPAASQLISIQPPKLRRWDGNSVLLSGRIESQSLDDRQAAFFQPTAETLLLRSPSGRSPSVTLEPIDVSLGVSLRQSIESEGNDVLETIVVRAETTQPISELAVLTGNTRHTEFDWSLRRTDQSATISLPSSSIARAEDDPLGKYVIELDGRDLRDYELVGRRFYSAGRQLTLSLPSVSGATSRSAEVFLDRNWEVSGLPHGVQLVPGNDPAESAELPAEQSQHLRYDPLMRPEIQLTRARRDALACLIWDQSFEMIANSRGEDLFQLVAEVSTRKPIHVSYDHELEIVSVSRNGRPYRPERATAGEFWITPQNQNDQIVVRMRRRHGSDDWIRRCVIPRLSIEGYVIRDRVSCRAGAGTLILREGQSSRSRVGRGSQSLSDGSTDSLDASRSAMSVRLGNPDELILVPRNVAIGFGWLGAAILFCSAWSIAKWFTLGIHSLFVLVVIAVSASIIWWPWQTAVLGWIAIPIAIAGLLHVVIDATTVRRATPRDPNATSPVAPRRSQANSGEVSTDFSISVPGSVLIFAAFCIATAAGQLMAQTPTAEETRRMNESDSVARPARKVPIDLLVPLGADHRPVGDKVYLSGEDYESIKSVVDPNRPTDARFRSAEYRVVLSPPRDVGQMIGAEIQADYQIELGRESTRVRLPVRAETLRRIELLVNDDSQIIRSAVDERGMVIAAIPPSRRIRLRLTFLPTLSSPGTVGPVRISGAGSPAGESEVELSGGVDGGGDNLGAAVRNPGGFPLPGTEPLSTVIRLAIPAVHSANLVVESPREIVVPSLGEPLGRTLFRPDLGRYEADLGPIRELVITCHPAKRVGQFRAPTLRRAYRIAAGIESTIVECELEPAERMAAGETLQLTILGAPPTSVTSSGWLLSGPETGEGGERSAVNFNPASGIYRFVKQPSVDSPLRLLWILPSVLNDSTSTSDSRIMPIPEVFASSSPRSTPTLFAIETTSSIRVSELANESRRATKEDFLAAWRGYLGPFDRAFVIQDTFPTFYLMQDKFPVPTVRLDHHLHVAKSRMELVLRAEIVDAGSTIKRVLVSLPEGFRLVRSLVNGESDGVMTAVADEAAENDVAIELSLGDQRDGGTMIIELVGESRFQSGREIKLPQFQLMSDGETKATYRITRDRSLMVELLEPADADPDSDFALAELESLENATPEMTQADLLAGRIPVAMVMSPDAFRMNVTPLDAGNTFACDQTTLMRYSDGQWFCDTLLELPRRETPDYVDLEIPTRWASNLEVSGAAMWCRRDSSDEVVTVVRMALPEADGQESVRRLLITGGLDNRDQNRVVVPVLEVLGAGRRNHVVAVPGQLTTESIEWLPQGVQPFQAGQDWFVPFGGVIPSPEIYTLYQVEEKNWSIELEPLSQATIDPVALSCDVRVFLEGDHALVFQRFDLLPETRDEVTIEIPLHGNCIGIWSAGREVNLNEMPSAAANRPSGKSDERNAKRVRVPLSYSRLPQALEILIDVPVVDRELADYLSRLIGIPTNDTWLAFYQAPPDNQSRRLRLARPTESTDDLSRQRRNRAYSFAESVVTAIDRSRDMLAERSDEEIQRWLFPWMARYQLIAGVDGHRFRMVDLQIQEGGEVPGQEEADGRVLQSPSADSQKWESFDARVLQLAGRFLQSQPQIPQPLFSQDRFSDYDLIAVMPIEAGARPPRLTQAFTQRKSLQRLLLNAITLLTFGLAIVLLWPFRGRFRNWINEPAVWLFVVGFVGLFLIPKPLAFSLMIVAVTVPLINRMKSKTAAANS